MEVGKPQREIYVEPLELPEPLRTSDPAPKRRERETPVEEPEKVEGRMRDGLSAISR